MTDERRYHDDEIAKIFEAAATPRATRDRALSPSSEEGLTLAELQDIGREVGVPPERIADAASDLDLRRGDLPRRTHLGMPISVHRTVELPRAPTDREWALIVTELRETFDAHSEECRSCAGRLEAQRTLDRRVGRLPDYRPPRSGPFRSTASPHRRLQVAAALTALLVGGLLADRARREAAETRMVQAALLADARMMAWPPGRSPAVARDEALPPWLGFVTCDEWIASDPEGVHICALALDGPLGRAGVTAGDVLLAVGRHRIASAAAMHRRLARHDIGDVAAVAIRRQDGTIERLRVRLDERRFGERHPFDMDWSPALVESLDRVAPGAVAMDDVFHGDSATVHGRGLRVRFEPSADQTRRTLLRPLPHLFGPGRLRAGDLIVRIEDERIERLWDLFPALMRVQHRASFAIHVVRDGEPAAITISNPRGTEP